MRGTEAMWWRRLWRGREWRTSPKLAEQLPSMRPRVAPGDPGDRRSCPTIAESLPRSCPKLAHFFTICDRKPVQQARLRKTERASRCDRDGENRPHRMAAQPVGKLAERKPQRAPSSHRRAPTPPPRAMTSRIGAKSTQLGRSGTPIWPKSTNLLSLPRRPPASPTPLSRAARPPPLAPVLQHRQGLLPSRLGAVRNLARSA